MHRRAGVTLIELLVVFAILGVLLALLLSAVQRVREAAARSQSMNKLRQISIATENFASAHEGRLPNVAGARGSLNPRVSVLFALLPFLEQGNVYNRGLAAGHMNIDIFLSAADPSLELLRGRSGASSFAANAQVFTGSPSLPTTFLDGTSNTIIYGEHYAVCDGEVFWYAYADPNIRRATFADGGPDVERMANPGDIWPITSGAPPVSKGACPPDWTFQVAPNPNLRVRIDPHPTSPPPMPKGCYERLANTPHQSGMVTAWGDGSVRILAGGVAPNIYWGAVTPAGGEILNLDW
jgi:prepilin-type N-terminal cleavage/methylation domain-containing protein